MKNIKIGFFFGTLLHENMGCNALNYSFIQLCEEIAKIKNWHFQYVMFWDIPSSFKHEDLPTELRSYDITFQKVPDSYFRLFIKGLLKDHMHDYNEFYNTVKSCDFFVDSCGGDSFSDIYGNYTLRYIHKNHKLAYKYNKPIILLPQTIGPFNTREGEKRASQMMQKATMIYVRDELSKTVAQKYISQNKIFYTIDMAFQMKYPTYKDIYNKNKTRIGVSPSALLWNGGYTGQNQFGLKSNYKNLIRDIIKHLIEKDYEVNLLAHVLYGTASKPREDDYWLCKQLHEEFPATILAPYFYSPTEAKSFIATLNGLMSSRMHCCIGAYSSGVPVFTLGYSRKFNGLFNETLKYRYGSDLRIDDIPETIENLDKYLINLSNIKAEMPSRLLQIAEYRKTLIDSFTNTITKCITK